MLSNKHFISLKDTPKEDIMKLIETGLSFREVLERPVKKVPTLSGKNILNLFFPPGSISPRNSWPIPFFKPPLILPS